MRRFLICLIIITNFDTVFCQDTFLNYVYKICSQNLSFKFSRFDLDSIIKCGRIVFKEDSFSIYAIENQGYSQTGYVKLLDYMPSGQAAFSIHEIKLINFQRDSFIIYSMKYGLSHPCEAYILDSLKIFKIKDGKLVNDILLENSINDFRKYCLFTNDTAIISKDYPQDFCFDLMKDIVNEISIKFNLSCDSYNEINDKLDGNILRIRFNNTIETNLIKE